MTPTRMLTTIGRQLHDSPRGLIIVSVTGGFAIAADLAMVWWDHYPDTIEGRGVIALVTLAVYLYIVRGDLASVGLTATPAQSWGYWFRATLLIGLAVGGIVVAGLGTWLLLGQELPVHRRVLGSPPQPFGVAFLRMCVFAPVLEEVTYRMVICVPLAAWRRPWLAILASGLAFAGLHLISGNPSPENLIGGLFLAWAYLKSGTICIPLILHGLGNLCVLVGQMGAWYWFRGIV